MQRNMILGLLLASATGAAGAAEIGNPQAGREIAARWCAECHDIAAPPVQMRDKPPAFVSVANRAETTAAGLRAFLQTPHAEMPDLALSRDETDHIIAYILGLKRR